MLGRVAHFSLKEIRMDPTKAPGLELALRQTSKPRDLVAASLAKESGAFVTPAFDLAGSCRT